VSRATVRVSLVATLLVGILCACRGASWRLDPAAVYFPLKPHMMWMYKIDSKSQSNVYVVTDMVLGSQYVPSLKVTGAVVQEFYNFDRAGLRPLVYVQQDGYWTRLSGLDYVKKEITAPSWGRSEEADFLPQHLAPNLSWSNRVYPYGMLPGAFEIDQEHKSFRESKDVVVPAGRFSHCIRIETLAHYEGGAYSRDKLHLKLTYEDWYAPNVGLVRTVAYQGDGGGPEMERVELIKFDSGIRTSAASHASEKSKNS
jgi:hypothetical protein